jgi:hypothetical protein
MPDQFGNPTEAELRGQRYVGYAPPAIATSSAIADRAAAARAGNGTIDTYYGDGTSNHITGAQLRNDPAHAELRQQMLNRGVSDPNMLFGPTSGRVIPAAERQYREAYRRFMENPNKGVDAQEALRAVAIWATVAIGGGALAGQAAAAGAGAGAGTAAGVGGGSATSGFSALAPGTAAGTATGLGTGAAGGLQASSGLGLFANGGTAGLAGLGGGNAGALAASGAIAGGAGAGGTIQGALGGASRLANSVSGVGSGVSGGGSMGWWDNLADVLPAIGSLYGSYQQRGAAGDAADAQVNASREAIAEQRRQFDTQIEMLRPQRELGINAMNVLGRLNGFNTGAEGGAGAPDMSAFTASPDYNFRRSEGNRDINNSFAARGGALSGNALRGITDYNSNLASGEFNNFVQRQLQMAGLGGAATSQSVNASQYAGGNVSNLLGNQGDARASGIINQSNAVTGGLNDLGTWFGNWNQNRKARAVGYG